MAIPVSELQSVNPSSIIELFELELFANIHGSSFTYRFHAGTNALTTNGDIVWDGNTYSKLPIEADGFEYNAESGSLPRPTIRVANLLGSITAILLDVNETTAGNDLTGAKLTRIRTLVRYIDAANFTGSTNPYGTPDTSAKLPDEIYYCARKVTETRDLVEFELASAFDLAGVRAPKRQCISRCQWVYKSAECGYNPTVGPGKTVDGVNYRFFTANDQFQDSDGNAITEADDVCGKRQSSCECRFGENKELPFGGYPGIGTFFS